MCLVENEQGYRNLCRLLTCRHMGGDYVFSDLKGEKGGSVKKPSAAADFCLKDALARFSRGLVVLAGNAKLLRHWYDAGVNVFASMPRHPLHRKHPLRKTAEYLGVSMVAVPGSFFLRPEHHLVHQYLRAIDKTTSLFRLSSGDVAPKDAWFAPPEEYERRFSICPEALYQTLELSERLFFTGPDFGLVMPPWSGGDKNADRILREKTYEGARIRYGEELGEAVVDRIEHELKTISQMGFSAYFLVVKDIVEQSSRTCGRGSGAASVVAYCLKITNVCPVRHNLYFERFLNPGRKDPPDIDVDFAWDERDQILKNVLEHYGNHAAMVCNHVTFKPRMAVREVAKVFGLTDAEISRVSKKLPWFRPEKDSGKPLIECLKKLPGLKHFEFGHPWPEIIHIAQQIMGIPRYVSVHPGGVVITPRPVCEYVPVEKAVKGVPIIQWEKDAVEDSGLVKIDLLGNRSLGVIRDAVANVRKNGRPFCEAGWKPEDDFMTQEAVAQGRTMGCFYIESPAMRLLQQKAGVGDFKHLVIHSSIIRPAANDFIREYIRRLHGGAWDPVHPLLEDVLADTFGIMVYQEDVAKTAVSLAGFSHAEADGLRKIMSRKDRKHQLQDYYRRFSEGARNQGVTSDQIEAVWDMMMSFSGYSFCKPHSASYARVSFQAAYLKVHFPAEFMAAVISNQGGFYSTSAYVSESRRLGLKVLPPDINQSEIRWTGCGDTIRAGFLAIKTLSRKTMDRIIAERQKRFFSSLYDFLDRVCPEEPEVRALIHCGAMDGLHEKENRMALLWRVSVRQNTASRKSTTISLFSEHNEGDVELPVFPAENQQTKLRREFAVLGFLCDRHPVTLYDHLLKNKGIIKAFEISKFVDKTIRFAGWLVTGKTVHTRHGDPMEFLTFEDDTGVVETTFFPEAYKRFCNILDRGRPYILTGKVDQDWGAATLTVKKVECIDYSESLSSFN